MNTVGSTIVPPEPPTTKIIRHNMTHRWVTVIAITIGVAMHGVWLAVASFNLDLELFEPDKESEPLPEVSFLGTPVSDGTSQSVHDIRLIRSPVLFALPTHVGFSGPLLDQADLKQPPEREELPMLLLRPLEKPFQSSAYGASARNLNKMAQQPRSLPMPPLTDESADIAGERVNQDNLFLLYWVDRPDVAVQTIPIPNGTPWAGTESWEMVLYIGCDPEGFVDYVIIEKPGPAADINQAALRISRQLSLTNPQKDSCGRLVIKYLPSAEEQDG